MLSFRYLISALLIACFMLSVVFAADETAPDFTIDLENHFTGQWMELEDCDNDDNDNDAPCAFPLFFDQDADIHYVCRGYKNENDEFVPDLVNLNCVEVELY